MNYKNALYLYRMFKAGVKNPDCNLELCLTLQHIRCMMMNGVIPNYDFFYINEFNYNIWVNRNSNKTVPGSEMTYNEMFRAIRKADSSAYRLPKLPWEDKVTYGTDIWGNRTTTHTVTYTYTETL